MTAEIYQMPKPTLHLYCAKCGVASEPRCDCNVGYITAGEVARRAVAANPEMSDRAIADKIGVAKVTVQRARQSGGPNDPPAKRTGKDGKSYTAKPTRKAKHPREVEDRAARMVLDEGKRYDEAGGATGIGIGTVHKAVTREKALREAAADPIIDPSALSMSMQQKNEVWRRQEKKRLEIEIDSRLREEQRERLETLVLPSLRKRRAEADKVIAARKGPLSKAEYRLIERCLHPDNTASGELRAEAFRMFRGKKLVLVNEAEAPTESPTIPTTVAEWEAMKRKASQ
jgi:hypothetical protein